MAFSVTGRAASEWSSATDMNEKQPSTHHSVLAELRSTAAGSTPAFAGLMPTTSASGAAALDGVETPKPWAGRTKGKSGRRRPPSPSDRFPLRW